MILPALGKEVGAAQGLKEGAREQQQGTEFKDSVEERTRTAAATVTNRLEPTAKRPVGRDGAGELVSTVVATSRSFQVCGQAASVIKEQHNSNYPNSLTGLISDLLSWVNLPVFLVVSTSWRRFPCSGTLPLTMDSTYLGGIKKLNNKKWFVKPTASLQHNPCFVNSDILVVCVRPAWSSFAAHTAWYLTRSSSSRNCSNQKSRYKFIDGNYFVRLWLQTCLQIITLAFQKRWHGRDERIVAATGTKNIKVGSRHMIQSSQQGGNKSFMLVKTKKQSTKTAERKATSCPGKQTVTSDTRTCKIFWQALEV